MDADESLRRFGFVPADESLPMIRDILANQAAVERKEQGCDQKLLLLCCIQLFSRGLLEDVLRVWDAKCSSMDNDCIVDVQFLCGAGLEATKRYLSSQQGGDALSALKYLGKCEATGDFERFAPAEFLESKRDSLDSY